MDFEEGPKWLVLKYAGLTRGRPEPELVDEEWEQFLEEELGPGLPSERYTQPDPPGSKDEPNLKASNSQPVTGARRRVLKVFAALFATPVAFGSVRPEPASRHRALKVLETRIAGFAYYDGKDCLTAMEPGDKLELRREPGNSHGGKAVAVYWRHKKIGYVPRRNNAALSQLMDGGELVSARIRG